LGGHHESWLGNALLGSVSLHVLHHARTSVLVAHRAPTGSGRILFGTDGSRGAGIALRTLGLALDRGRAQVEVASVVPPRTPIVVPLAPGVHLSPLQDPDVLDAHEKARDEVARCADSLRARGITTTTALLTGSPGAQLLKEADNIGADLVVVGSRGLGPVRRAMVGSVGDRIVRHAPAALVARDPRTPKDPI
jgi:nucleotide-binding universal stress UspA family protein